MAHIPPASRTCNAVPSGLLPDSVTVGEAALLLRVGRSTAYRAIETAFASTYSTWPTDITFVDGDYAVPLRSLLDMLGLTGAVAALSQRWAVDEPTGPWDLPLSDIMAHREGMILPSSGTARTHALLRLFADLPATLTVQQAAHLVGRDETAVYRATKARRDGDIGAWPTEVIRIGKRRILIPTIPLLEAVGITMTAELLAELLGLGEQSSGRIPATDQIERLVRSDS